MSHKTFFFKHIYEQQSYIFLLTVCSRTASSFHCHPYISFSATPSRIADVTYAAPRIVSFLFLLRPSYTICRSAAGISCDRKEMMRSARTVSSGLGMRLEGGGSGFLGWSQGAADVLRTLGSTEDTQAANESSLNSTTHGIEGGCARRQNDSALDIVFKATDVDDFGVTVKVVEGVKGVEMRRWDRSRLPDWQK